MVEAGQRHDSPTHCFDTSLLVTGLVCGPACRYNHISRELRLAEIFVAFAGRDYRDGAGEIGHTGIMGFGTYVPETTTNYECPTVGGLIVCCVCCLCWRSCREREREVPVDRASTGAHRFASSLPYSEQDESKKLGHPDGWIIGVVGG